MHLADATPAHFHAWPDRLNLGCGFDRREGYLNVDWSPMHQPDLVADVLKLDRLPAGHYREVLAQDILEHLPRTATQRALLHWARLLRPGGELVLRVPDVLGLARLLAAPENQSLARQEQLIQCLFGTQAYTGDFHCTAFTALTLRAYLERCGFEVLELGTRDGWMHDVRAAKRREVAPRDVDDFSELLETAGPDEAFVAACYRTILEREADEGGLAFYTRQLGEGVMNREQLLGLLVGSEERQQRRAAGR